MFQRRRYRQYNSQHFDALSREQTTHPLMHIFDLLVAITKTPEVGVRSLLSFPFHLLFGLLTHMAAQVLGSLIVSYLVDYTEQATEEGMKQMEADAAAWEKEAEKQTEAASKLE